MDTLDKFPTNVLTIIAAHINNLDAFRRTCKAFYRSTRTKLLWKHKLELLQREFQIPPDKIHGETFYLQYLYASRFVSSILQVRKKKALKQKCRELTRQLKDLNAKKREAEQAVVRHKGAYKERVFRINQKKFFYESRDNLQNEAIPRLFVLRT